MVSSRIQPGVGVSALMSVIVKMEEVHSGDGDAV